jgi:hypothetical protein
MVQEHKPKKRLPASGYAAAAGIPAAIAMLIARRGRGGLLGPELMEAARAKGVFRHVDETDAAALDKSPLRSLLAYLTYGTKHVGTEAPRGAGMVDINPLKKPGGPLGVGPNEADIRDFREGNKLKETALLHKLAPGITPKFTRLSGVLKGTPPTGPALEPWLRKNLKVLGPKWILKGKKDFDSAGGLLTDQADLKKVLPYMNHPSDAMIPGIDMTPNQLEEIRRSPSRANEWSAALKQNPEYAMAWRLKGYLKNPGSGFAQTRTQIATNPFLGKQEYRVHVLNGKVVPGTTSRYNKVRHLLGMLGLDPGAHKAEQALREHLEPALAARGSSLSGGFDVGLDPSGKATAFEANPNSYSGHLYPNPSWNPMDIGRAAFSNHSLQGAIQGRDTWLMAGLKGTGAAAAGAGAYGAARELQGDKTASLIPTGPPHKKKALPASGYAAAAGIPAALAYAIARRGRGGILSPEMTELVRQKGLFRHVPQEDFDELAKQKPGVMRDLLAYLTYGTKHVGPNGEKAPRGMVNFRADRNPGGRLGIGPTAGDLKFFGVDDKLKELQSLRKLVPGLVPEVTPLSKVLGGPVPKGDALRPWLEERLNKLPPQWIMKGRRDFQSAGTLFNDQSNLDDILPHFSYAKGEKIPGTSMTPRDVHALKDDPEEWISALKENPDYAQAWRLQSYLRNPTLGFVQPRVDLERPPWGLASEYRVHMVNGRVIPGAEARHKTIQGYLGQLGLDPGARRAEQALRDHLEPQLAKRNSQLSGAFDVGFRKGGKPIIFEANPNSHSGLLYPTPKWVPDFFANSTLTNHNLQSEMQGRDTHLLASIKALGAGGVGLGGYGAARGLAGDQQQ